MKHLRRRFVSDRLSVEKRNLFVSWHVRPLPSGGPYEHHAHLHLHIMWSRKRSEPGPGVGQLPSPIAHPIFVAVKYTIGHQDFRKIREEGFQYVDKTEHICRLIENGGYLFLSRPRRFGKSLTVSTMNELYSGSEELFEGLWAGKHWNFAEKQRPVIWLQFASSTFQVVGLVAGLNLLISKQALKLGLEVPEGDNYALRFQHLIQGAAAKHPSGKVVLLIDEYDKPILEYLDNVAHAEANRDILKAFYAVLKDADLFLFSRHY